MPDTSDWADVVKRISGKPPSTKGKTRHTFDVRETTNWLNEKPQDPTGNTRTLGYLVGYFDAAGSEAIPASGIQLEERVLHLDKNVMSDLLHAGMVELKDGDFLLTSAGKDYVAGATDGEDTMNDRERMQEMLEEHREGLLAEYDTLASMTIEDYLKANGLSGQYRSRTYFFVRDGRYLDMKAPIRVALAGEDLPVQQSNAMYRAMKNLGLPVVHDITATGSDPLEGNRAEREVPRYLALARPQQARFRKDVMEAFGGTCCITGCDTAIALEAAHIVPYARNPEDPEIDHVSNGLPMRRDIHAVFDAGMIELHPTETTADYVVVVKGDVSEMYSVFDGRKVTLAKGPNLDRIRERLAQRLEG